MVSALDLANVHYEHGKVLQAQAAGKLLALWRGVDRRNILASWTERLPEAVSIVTATQLSAAEDGTEYMAAALAAQSLDVRGPQVVPRAFAGVAYPLTPDAPAFDLAGTLSAPAFTALRGIRGGLTLDRAMGGGLNDLLLRSQVQVADAARNSGAVVMASRQKPAGWVRMLNPPSCSRCTLLAGKWFRYNQGFARHPGCDCRHIPSAESSAGEVVTTDPYKYFSSLPGPEQDRLFTKAGAKAIRDGADIFQVVNARQGMYTTAGGSQVTREGVTRRGHWGSQQETRDRKGSERYGVSRRQRMMPEEIYKRAKTPERAQALLQEYGYITSAGQAPGGAIAGSGRGFSDRYRLNG